MPESSFRHIAAGQDRSATDVVSSIVHSLPRVQTSIDRDSGTAAEGQLFETDCQYLASGRDSLAVYVRTDKHLDMLAASFRALALTGYGKKSGTGLGEFELLDELERCEWLDGSSGCERLRCAESLHSRADGPGGRSMAHACHLPQVPLQFCEECI